MLIFVSLYRRTTYCQNSLAAGLSHLANSANSIILCCGKLSPVAMRQPYLCHLTQCIVPSYEQRDIQFAKNGIFYMLCNNLIDFK